MLEEGDTVDVHFRANNVGNSTSSQSVRVKKKRELIGYGVQLGEGNGGRSVWFHLRLPNVSINSVMKSRSLTTRTKS